MLLLCSCSVQKRHYKSGYYISWNKTHTNKKNLHYSEKERTSAATKQNKLTERTSEGLYVSADNTLNAEEFKSGSPRFFLPEDSCDVIIFKDGTEVKAKVNEVGISEIKYKRCNNPDGPNHISRKSEIFMIKYANGTKEVVRSESGESLKTYESSQPRRPSRSDARSKPRRIHPLAVPSLVVGSADYFVMFYAFILAASGFSYAILLLPILIGIGAFVMGRLVINDIKEKPDTYKGKGLAIAGMITGMIFAGISLLVLFLISIIV
ncbi:MAG: DUF4190 domain-containing protein [Bacteroidia bacterium]|nr:DUF4190 domain-containing protein [Bacteroidia bacterium]